MFAVNYRALHSSTQAFITQKLCDNISGLCMKKDGLYTLKQGTEVLSLTLVGKHHQKQLTKKVDFDSNSKIRLPNTASEHIQNITKMHLHIISHLGFYQMTL